MQEAGAAEIGPRDATSTVLSNVADPVAFSTPLELRFGGFAHGIGNAEKGTWDVNGEIVLPKFGGPSGDWSLFIPRIHAGATGNTGGRTSSAYAGLLWTVPIFDRVFAEAFLDAALHDGSLTGTFTRSALGCNPLFHVGSSLGYRLDQNWSVMFTFEHLSNGAGLGLTNCSRNQGLNNLGGRIGYAF